MTTRVQGPSASDGSDFRELASRRHQEATFEQMLNVSADNMDAQMFPPPPPPPLIDNQGFGETTHRNTDGHDRPEHSGDQNDTSRAEALRQKAADLRDEAEELRERAASVDGTDAAPHMAQVFLNRAEALEQRAEAREKEAETVEAREVDRRHDRELNGKDEPFRVAEGAPTPRDPDAMPVVGWGTPEQVEAYEIEINAIDEFSDVEVVSTREATDAEVDHFLDLAEEMGMDDIEFAAGYLQAFPIQFVYVENLKELGYESATMGELFFDNKSIVLMDADFESPDITADRSEFGQEAMGAMDFSFSTIIEVMLEQKAIEMATTPTLTASVDMMHDDQEDEKASTAPVAGSSGTPSEPDE